MLRLLFPFLLTIVFLNTHFAHAQSKAAAEIKKEESDDTPPIEEIDIQMDYANLDIVGTEAGSGISYDDSLLIYCDTFIENKTLNIRAKNEDTTTITLHMQVPKDKKIKVNLKKEGNINISRMNSYVQASTHKGNITLNNLDGWAVLNTDLGNIKASFANVNPEKPMSFIAYQGNIELMFPKNLQANFLLKTNNSLQNDFEIDEDENREEQMANFFNTNAQENKRLKESNLINDAIAEKQKTKNVMGSTLKDDNKEMQLFPNIAQRSAMFKSTEITTAKKQNNNLPKPVYLVQAFNGGIVLKKYTE
ncbi:MAG: hypothetical protein EAZ55_12320 [Cytophagales bacterium]|nr:MAG: hypothetical protein EAZ55_12320 [Cytophagales bacterium]